MLPNVCLVKQLSLLPKNHWILSIHSSTKRYQQNVSWPHFSWSTLYVWWPVSDSHHTSFELEGKKCGMATPHFFPSNSKEVWCELGEGCHLRATISMGSRVNAHRYSADYIHSNERLGEREEATSHINRRSVTAASTNTVRTGERWSVMFAGRAATDCWKRLVYCTAQSIEHSRSQRSLTLSLSLSLSLCRL